METKYKFITIKEGKSKYPKVYSGEYVIAELHDDYVAFTDQKEMEFHFNDIESLSVAWKIHKDKKDKRSQQ